MIENKTPCKRYSAGDNTKYPMSATAPGTTPNTLRLNRPGRKRKTMMKYNTFMKKYYAGSYTAEGYLANLIQQDKAYPHAAENAEQYAYIATTYPDHAVNVFRRTLDEYSRCKAGLLSKEWEYERKVTKKEKGVPERFVTSLNEKEELPECAHLVWKGVSECQYYDNMTDAVLGYDELPNVYEVEPLEESAAAPLEENDEYFGKVRVLRELSKDEIYLALLQEQFNFDQIMHFDAPEWVVKYFLARGFYPVS